MRRLASMDLRRSSRAASRKESLALESKREATASISAGVMASTISAFAEEIMVLPKSRMPRWTAAWVAWCILALSYKWGWGVSEPVRARDNE